LRVVVTGGAGFIGSHLCEALVEHGHHVTALDDFSTGSRENLANLSGRGRFKLVEGSVLEETTVDRVLSDADLSYHLAAAVGVRTILDRPLQSMLINVRGTEVVLQAADRHGVPIVVASTSEVYGKNDSGPLSEDSDRILGSSQISRWHYASAKAVDEALTLSFVQENGLKAIVVRLFNTVGPRQSGRYGMVVPRLAAQALAGEPLTVFGDGQQTRCFTYVGDVVRCLIALPETPAAWGQVFNIGHPTEVSILDLAKRLRSLAGSRSEIVLVPYGEAYGDGFEDMRRRVPDLAKLHATLGFVPDTRLDETLKIVLASALPAACTQPAPP
jgi:UDP-glucose 4-epimerase